MTTHRNDYQPFFAHLQSLNLHFLETWVVDCINYYKSINPGISNEVLKNEVKQQWLLVNLREIKVPSLPPDLKSKEKIILNGAYAVQVESMMDSSESCYSQFQKLQNVNTENIEATKAYSQGMEWNTKSNRCLTFLMCDGVQEIEAMEYQPIKKIRTNDPELLPGFKMVIVGPVECRRGMILLKDENVRVYGGEVDTLTETNNLKSLLIKRLDLDENDYPDNTCSGYHSSIEEDKSEIPQSSFNAPANASNLDEECVESLLSQNDDLFLNLSLEPDVLAEETKSKNTINTENEIDMFSDDIIYWNEDVPKQYNETSNHKKHSLPQDVPTPSPKRRSLDPDLEDTANESFKWNSTIHSNFNEPSSGLQDKFCSSPLKSKKPVQTKLSSFFKSSDLSLNSVSRIATELRTPVLVSDEPFVYLRQILSRDVNRGDVFTIKGIILTLRKKITIENDEFNLKANVTDGSASVDVDFSSGILEELLGFSPCEMTVMMKARQTNTAIGQRIKESFLKTQEKLISLNCLMKIQFFNDERIPLILFLEEVTFEHLKALKERRLK